MSKTLSNTQTKSSLLAAFTSPIKKASEQNSKSNKTSLKAANSTESVCSCSGSDQGDDLYLQEQQGNHLGHQQQQDYVSPYATFTQDIEHPTFVSVFPSVEAILPHANDSHKGQVSWKCCNCDAVAFGHKCNNCFRIRDQAALRVFLGQLSKEGDVDLVSKMIEVLCPEVDLSQHLFHIEPHTSANTARGKGCAWAYVDSLDHLLYICKRLHKRTYPTVNAQTGEVGFVAFPDTYAEADIKQCFDNDMSFLPESVQALFHRSPITAEVPKTLQRILDLPQNASSVSMNVYQQQRQQQLQQKQKFFFEQQQAREQQAQQQVQQQQQAGSLMKPSAYYAPQQRIVQAVGPKPKVQQQQVQQQQTPKKMLNRFHWNPYSPSSTRTNCA